jgi:hypothetical protein
MQIWVQIPALLLIETLSKCHLLSHTLLASTGVYMATPSGVAPTPAVLRQVLKVLHIPHLEAFFCEFFYWGLNSGPTILSHSIGHFL